MNKVFLSLMTLVLLALGAMVMVFLIKGAPQPEKAARQSPPPTVETMLVSIADATPIVTVYGVVKPAQQMTLKSQVSGSILSLHPNLITGRRLQQGEQLIRIDEQDYRLAVLQQEEAVASARYQLDLESGRQTVAAEEWAIFADRVPATEQGKSLALREPHLMKAKATLVAAQSKLQAAQLNVARTVLVAPFNAVVLRENVEVGQVINTNSELVTLVNTDYFWVQASISYQDLKHIQWSAKSQGSEAQVKVAGSQGSWQGRVIQLLSDLEENGRMARILIEVQNPLQSGTGDLPLLLGAYVEADIQGRSLSQVIALPHAALRENQQDQAAVWIMTPEDRLETRWVELAWQEKDAVYVKSGLEAGERIITSRLAVPLEGMALRTKQSLAGSGEGAAE